MSEFERLKRRNQDCLLIETVKRVGPSNYSLLARLTGLNPETVRYKISKQLGRFGLGISVNINYAELGFSLGLLTVRADSLNGRSWLDHAHYLMLSSKEMGSDRYVCLYGIPYRFKKKYADSFEELKAKSLIQGYEMNELYWIRYPPFRSELYDFEKKGWSFDWRRVDSATQEAGTASFSVNHDPKVDDVDIKILKYLKEDPTTGLARVAKEIGVNPRTLRYHYSEHVVKGKLIMGNNIRWTWPLQQGKGREIMQVMVAFKSLEKEEMATVRKLFNKLPFTWVEGGTDGRDYVAFMDTPIMIFHETLRYIEDHLGAMKSKLEVTILDSEKTQYMNVPDEMFDKRLGWRLFGVNEGNGGEAQPQAIVEESRTKTPSPAGAEAP